MITEKYRFYVSIGLVGAKREETVEIEFEGNESDEEKEKILQENYDTWLMNFADLGWSKVDD